jgi:hypothetical protein
MNLLSSAVMLCGVAMASAAQTSDDCDTLYNANIKSLQTPHHVYSTKTSAGGVKAPASEAIFTAEAEYVRIHGNWQRSPMMPRDMIAAAQEKLKSRPDICSVAKTETINGEVVTTYKVHNKATDSDSQVRILQSSGLLQGQSLLLPDKSRMEVRYEYTNVHLPGA